MSFFGFDGLDHQLKQLKSQLASKGWFRLMGSRWDAESVERLRIDVYPKRAEEKGRRTHRVQESERSYTVSGEYGCESIDTAQS